MVTTNMIGVLFGVFTLAAAHHVALDCPLIDEEVILHPNVHNCTTFYKCQEGEAVELECPDGLQFNPILSVCDWYWNVNCVAEPSAFDILVDDQEHSLITQPPPTCPGPGTEINATLFSNPYNCSTYWFCESGIPELKACPPDLHFNDRIGVCDFPFAAGCKSLSPVITADLEAPASGFVVFDLLPDDETHIPITQPPPTCPAPGTEVNATLFANPYNCSTYWLCESGIPEMKACPGDLHFNERIGVCDFPFAAGCKQLSPVITADFNLPAFKSVNHLILEEEFLSATGTPPICPPPGTGGNVTTFRNPYNCSNYWYCDNGTPHLRDCPPGLQFNEKNGVCDFPWAFVCVEETLPEGYEMEDNKNEVNLVNLEKVSATGTPPICPPPGTVGNVTTFRNPYNCSNYWYCDNGTPHLRDCPPGLQFNEKNGVCDFPWAFVCVEETLPEGYEMEDNKNEVNLVNLEEVSATGTPPICPPPGTVGNVTTFRNPYNCSNYWYCDNGVASLRDCPPGLQFNEVNGVCDYPWAFVCVEETLPESYEVEFILNKIEELSNELRLLVNLLDDLEEISATGTPPICPPPGTVGNVTTFRNPYNCSNYWYCDNGVASLRDCPPGLQFNEVNGVCDYPWAFTCVEETLPEGYGLEDLMSDVKVFKNNVLVEVMLLDNLEDISATGTPPVCPPPGSTGNVTTFRNPYNCSNYWYCDNGTPHLRDCPPGLQFNEANGVCDFPWAFTCVEEPLPDTTTESTTVEATTPESTLPTEDSNKRDFEAYATIPPPTCPPLGSQTNLTTFPNPYNCSTYYFCDNGVRTLRSCPAGLHYNAKEMVCDHIWAAGCTELVPEPIQEAAAPEGVVEEEFLSATGTPPICPPPGTVGNVTTFRNPYNCSNYWYCDNGVASLRDCPPGLQFNEVNGVCDYPWAFVCVEETLPETVEEEEEKVAILRLLAQLIEKAHAGHRKPVGSTKNTAD